MSSIPCCHIKLLAYQNFPDNKGLEMMHNRLIELERQVASIQADIIAETNDDPKLLVAREFRLDGFLYQRSENILKGIIVDPEFTMPDFKALRLAELTATLAYKIAERDEVAALVYNLNQLPGSSDPEIVVPAAGAVIPEPEP